MMRSACPIMMVLAMVACAGGAEPQVSATLERNEVFEGQSVLFKVRVDNAKNPASPELGKLDDFDSVYVGENPFDLRSVEIINGRRREFVKQGNEYHFRLVPKKTGQLTVPSLPVKADGKTLHTPSVALRVLPAGQQDLAFLEVRADRDQLYPTQTFTLTISIAVKPLPDPLAHYEPVAVQQSPPMLTIPWADDEKLPAGVRPERPAQRWLQAMVDEHGFGINQLAQSLLLGQRYVSFRTEPRRVARKVSDGQPLQYWQYEFSRKFTAQRPGSCTLGPVTLQGVFAAAAKGATRPMGREVFAMARPVTITVKEPPAQGRPASYVGVVGRFEVRAEIAPREAKIGDPITLTLALSGQGSLDSAVAPKLEQVPEIARRFKLYEATGQADASSCRFTYSLRPLVESRDPFPALPLAFFDPETEKYVVVHTEPVPIRVAAADRLSQDQIVGASRGPTAGRKELEARREGVFANVTDVGAVRDESIRPERWLLGLAGLGAGYLAVAIGVSAIRRRSGDPALVRRRAAAPTARRKLHAVARLLSEGQSREAVDAIQAAVSGLVADVAGLSEAGLTPKDVVHELESSGLDAGLIARTDALLGACDAARYGVSAAVPQELAQQAAQLLAELIAAFRRGRRFT